MTDPNDDLDERLTRLARSTEPLKPGPGFQARVRGALRREREGDSRRLFVRAGRSVLAGAALVAAFVVAFAADRSHAADESMAIQYGVIEVDW